MKILLVTNSDIVSKVVKVSLDSLNIENKAISSINNFEACDILLLDDMFKDVNLEQIIKKVSLIGVITNKSKGISSSIFIIKRPFLPSTLISIINKNIDNLLNKRKREIEESILLGDRKNEDESIIKADSLSNLVGSLDKNEIKKLKQILVKDHCDADGVFDIVSTEGDLESLEDLIVEDHSKTIDNYTNDDTLSELDDIMDEIILQMKKEEEMENNDKTSK
jgi:hypothetical protein